MSEKLSKQQQQALRALARGPVSDMANHIYRLVTMKSLVDRGLATFTRLDVVSFNRTEWETEITDKGRAVVSQWAGTERWLRMTGAAK